jgi:hypothetical protein
MTFVPRALALQRSITTHSPDAMFAYYCVDRGSAEFLERHASPTVKVVPPGHYESEQLQAARTRLKLNEYCWTCKPFVLFHALDSFPGLEWAIWLDADMLAFGDLDLEIRRHLDANVILTPHRFSLPEFAAYKPSVGLFNAGYVAFRNTPDGIAALQWWGDKCLEGCPAQPTDDRYADQKYLNAMPQKFQGVAQSNSAGLNCAPWNVFEKKVAGEGCKVMIEKEPLLLYHFQGLKIIRSWAFDLYGAPLRLPQLVRDLIYMPYVDALATQIRAVARQLGPSLVGIDEDFRGARGILNVARRLRRSRNLAVRF